VELTAGPTSTFGPVLSPDGKKMYVISSQAGAELVRYDSAARQFTGYLPGVTAMGIDFSQDGRRVAYVAYPERTLWRCNTDGSEQLQLTFPPLKVIQPRWSPDGTRIAFMAQESFKPFRVYVIPADGGSPEQPTPSDRRGADPTWSTDGSSLLFGHPPGDEPPGALLGLEVVDLRTHAISKVPGSEGLWSPRWSPDGRYILAISRARDRLMLFEVNSQKWAELAKISVNWPQWSRKGDYIYFVGRPTVDQPTGVFRVRIRDRKLEQVISLKDFRHAPDDWGWLGLTPDDSPLLLRDTTTQDIYALDWEAP